MMLKYIARYMQTLWMHRAMEQLQHLIVRRTCHNGVPRAEVMYQWKRIQQEMEQTIEQMDKEYEANKKPNRK